MKYVINLNIDNGKESSNFEFRFLSNKNIEDFEIAIKKIIQDIR